MYLAWRRYSFTWFGVLQVRACIRREGTARRPTVPNSALPPGAKASDFSCFFLCPAPELRF